MLNKNKNKKTGFTLIDVIVAAGIIIAVIVPVFGLLKGISQASRYSVDRFIAANLAQEGIEIVRSIRDSNWIQMDQNPEGGTLWDSYLTDDGSYEVDYNSDYNNNPLTEVNGDSSLRYLQIDNNGHYGYDNNGAETKFKRKIKIDHRNDLVEGDNIPGIQILSTVSWDKGSVTAEDWLFDWQTH